ncbi:MAG: AAA family ATPase [Clostridia bacterium]|nr:AAA family ATPase [Clostridia bacterium]
MKINKLRVNAFGNLQNKDIEFKDGINIIYGQNESGKSTLLKFIIDMFYGISKNKRGKVFSDYDRYKPWNTTDFSGKIVYTLDDQSKYEIYRDFNKKNPKIYNENAEDISKNFNIDKTTGSEFFTEQTGLDENMFLSSLVSMQQEVVLNQNEQNVLIQKIANYTNSGSDNISYKKAIEKLNKKQVEEIGTSRTLERPINKIKEEKYELQDELGELEEFKSKKYELEDEKNTIKKEFEKTEYKISYLKELKKINEELNIEKEKNNINKNIILENNEKISELKNKKIKIEKEINNNVDVMKNQEKNNTNTICDQIKKKNKKINYLFIFSELIALFIFLINIIIFKIDVITIITALSGLFILLLFIFLKINNKNTNTIRDQIKKLNDELNKVDFEIEVLKKNNENKKIEIEKNNEKNNFEFNIKLEKIKNNYFGKIENFNSVDISELDELINKNNDNKIKLHTLQLDTECIVPKLEKLASNEERLEQLNEEEEELLKQNEAIELTKKLLENAYKKMKENVTPEFTKKLSQNVEKISNGKYKNIKINDEEGIIVEKDNGEYIEAQRLSVGTIDQLYLSLRFASINELTKENMPIVLDESFAYYDTNRLKNILAYLNKEFNNKQIIIFTCTDREREVLDELNINYNYITL